MFKLIKVNSKSEPHIRFLYEILLTKKFNISHEDVPNYNEHKKFVYRHPYRSWLMILSKDNFRGAVYLTKDNVIGINLPNANIDDYHNIINLIIKKYKPLKQVKSLKSKYFLININPKNNVLIKAVENLDMKYIQKTYALIP